MDTFCLIAACSAGQWSLPQHIRWHLVGTQRGCHEQLAMELSQCWHPGTPPPLSPSYPFTTDVQAQRIPMLLWQPHAPALQLWGYYFAALSVDFRPWGRRRMTTFSFLMVCLPSICHPPFSHAMSCRMPICCNCSAQLQYIYPGGVWLQVFSIFLSCYIAYNQLVKKAHIHWFQVSTG